MVHRPPRKKARADLLDNHQRSWIWGKHLLSEVLAAGNWPMRQLLLADDLPSEKLQEFQQRAADLQVPCEVLPRETITQRLHRGEHQGCAAQMGPFPYVDVQDVLRQASPPALLLVLDGIQDPHNLGAMLRSAEVFGVQGVCLQSSGQVPVNSQVARSSAGAVIRVPICRWEAAGFPQQLKSAKIVLVGASEKNGVPLPEFDFTQPVALVIGNEGQGISPDLAAHCQQWVRIEQFGQVGSLNAAAAAAIMFYEAQRQRRRTS